MHDHNLETCTEPNSGVWRPIAARRTLDWRELKLETQALYTILKMGWYASNGKYFEVVRRNVFIHQVGFQEIPSLSGVLVFRT